MEINPTSPTKLRLSLPKLRIPAASSVVTQLPVPVSLPSAPSWYSRRQLPLELQVDSDLFEVLWQLHPLELGKVKMFGKIIDTPRYQANYGKEYHYTGLTHPATPVPHPYLERLMAWVCADSGQHYEQMIINWYRDGSDYIGKHSDSESGLVPNSNIYSFSFGSSRDFVIRSKTGDFKQVLSLDNNDVLIMGGSMQRNFTHEVPKRVHAGRRINVTFRLMK